MQNVPWTDTVCIIACYRSHPVGCFLKQNSAIAVAERAGLPSKPLVSQ